MADRPTARSRSTSPSRKTTSSAKRTAAAASHTTAAEKPDGSVTSGADLDPDWLADVQALSFQEARTALELAMAQLQSDALEVEEMADLYRRAEAYAGRCEAVLRQVEQEVIQWEAEGAPPTP
ncbi:MAG: exodeoxyribonuclease VII small subunit [Vulcanococcus sp.]